MALERFCWGLSLDLLQDSRNSVLWLEHCIGQILRAYIKHNSLESWLTGTVFKLLDARQSEILTVLSRKSFSASAESTRFLRKIIKSL